MSDSQKAMLSTISCFVFMAIGFVMERFSIPFYQLIFAIAILSGGAKQTIEGLTDTFENKTLNVDLLMALAAIGAAIIGNWFEGAMLIFIFSLSGALEEYTTNKSKKEIASLMQLQPETALRLAADGTTTEVDVATLQIGDLVLVPKGASIPIDGEMIKGFSTIDEAAISGESIPVEKTSGDMLFGGTINLDNAITLKVTTKSDDTLFAKIIQLVNEAQSTPSQTASFIEKIENIYVKAVLIIIPLMIFIPYLFLGWSFYESFYRGMVLLVVASPCALVASATPATLAAISNGARNGVLFKGGIYLENLAALKAIAFDKTGTLTNGTPVVTNFTFTTTSQEQQQEAIDILLTIEGTSTHPLATAITSRFKAEHQRVISDIEIKDVTGFGLEGIIQNDSWKVGKEGFLEGSAFSETIKQEVVQWQNEGKTVIYLAKNDTILGYFGLLDVPKPEAAAAIAYFKQEGIHTTMITGDHYATAKVIGDALEIDEIHADFLPENKTTLINQQKETYEINAMVGDGINDAPALANASIGIAMGGGTDIAMDVADMVLMQNDLEKLQMSHMMSKKLKRIVLQNIIFSASIIFILILSNLFQVINLPLGVVGHEGSTILVILNGLRMLKTISVHPTHTSSIHKSKKQFA